MGEDVAILQSDNVMKTVLPEDEESMKWDDYDNMQVQDRMEQKSGWKALEQWELWK